MYTATVRGQSHTFEVAGFWRRNMLMRDLETGSVWQQATGDCIAGPRRGSQLEMLGADQVIWSAWRADHPDTHVAVEPPNSRRGIIYRLPYERLFERFGRASIVAPGKTAFDRRRPSREEVAGIVVNGEARAYPIATLQRRRILNDTLAGLPIAIVCATDGARIRAFHRPDRDRTLALTLDGQDLTDQDQAVRWNLKGEPRHGAYAARLPMIPVQREWWMAWSEFHPGTSVHAG